MGSEEDNKNKEEAKETMFPFTAKTELMPMTTLWRTRTITDIPGPRYTESALKKEMDALKEWTEHNQRKYRLSMQHKKNRNAMNDSAFK